MAAWLASALRMTWLLGGRDWRVICDLLIFLPLAWAARALFCAILWGAIMFLWISAMKL
jgi:hypothetical protein